MYHIRLWACFRRSNRIWFSTSRNLGQKSVEPRPGDSTLPSEAEQAREQEFISPLYTQKVGMFTRPGIEFGDDARARYRAYAFYTLSFLSFMVLVCMIKIVPPGHVGIVTRKNGWLGLMEPAGKVDQFNNKGRLALFHIPFLEKPVAFRITPIRKKIVRTCLTADSKKLEVVVFLTLTAKVPFASHIYSIFGVNYSKAFVDKELNFDIDQVVGKFRLDDLVFSTESIESVDSGRGVYTVNSAVERANEELIQRFEDAGLFNKIVVSDVNISYRRPDLVEAAG